VPTQADLQKLFNHVPADGSPIGNGAIREALGWDEARYEAVRDAMVAQGRLEKGRGRGGSVRRVGLTDQQSIPSEKSSMKKSKPAPAAAAKPAEAPAAQRAPAGPGFSGWVAPPYRDPESKSLEKKLWDAADELRANSNLKSSQYSAPVLGLIFLRFADVRFQARRKELVAAAASSRVGSKVDVPSAYHAAGVIWLPESARWDRLVNLPEGAGVGKQVNIAMVEIETANPQLAGTLPRSYESFDGLLLKNLLRKFAEIPVDLGFDAFGRIYEYFLGEFAMSEGQGGGEFYTPSSIVRLLVEVIEPFGGTILDPACGSGGMFVQSAAFVHAHKKADASPLRIYGQEKESATAALCRLNLAMHGLEGEIREAITYYEDAHSATGKFDFVLANPPFNVDNVDKARLAGGVGDSGTRFPWGVPSTDNANYLWISLFASALKPGGRAGFVMANSASDARGSELAIRQKMIQEGLVEAMVLVGSNMFYTVTLPVTLWFLRRAPTPTGKVLFIDARRIFRQIDRAHRDWPEAQIGFLSAIVRLFRGELVADVLGGKEAQAKLREVFGDGLVYRDVPGLCKAATISEIEAQGWSLTAGRYVGVNASQATDETSLWDAIAGLHSEFQRLSSEARVLEASIADNIVGMQNA
jgi:type I restriction enzyme M protein